MTTEVTVIGTLRTFLEDDATIAAAGNVLVAYPDEVADQSTGLVLLEFVESQSRDWIGMDAPFTNTAGKVDKGAQDVYVVRVECWARQANDPGGKSSQQKSLELLNAVKARLQKGRAELLQETGLHFQDLSRARALPFDQNHPDWYKSAVYFTGYVDDVWVETA